MLGLMFEFSFFKQKKHRFFWPLKVGSSLKAKAANHYNYQMSPKFLVNAILFAQLPDSMTSFARKLYPNTVIGARYPNTMKFMRYLPLRGSLISAR